jgi:uncharacterized protein YndB with AHSA1/START domain
MFGELETAGDGRWRLRFSRELGHPPEQVWRAITEPDHLAAWFPQRIEGDLHKPGAPLRFEHAGGIPGFEGQVLAVEPPSLLEFTWGPDTLRFDITPSGRGCILTLTDTITELGKAARDGAGWHACLDLLAASLDHRPAPTSGEIWQAVHPGYVASFGPAAATIGPPEGT